MNEFKKVTTSKRLPLRVLAENGCVVMAFDDREGQTRMSLDVHQAAVLKNGLQAAIDAIAARKDNKVPS